jgi:hypothetical protein
MAAASFAQAEWRGPTTKAAQRDHRREAAGEALRCAPLRVLRERAEEATGTRRSHVLDAQQGPWGVRRRRWMVFREAQKQPGTSASHAAESAVMFGIVCITSQPLSAQVLEELEPARRIMCLSPRPGRAGTGTWTASHAGADAFSGWGRAAICSAVGNAEGM